MPAETIVVGGIPVLVNRDDLVDGQIVQRTLNLTQVQKWVQQITRGITPENVSVTVRLSEMYGHCVFQDGTDYVGQIMLWADIALNGTATPRSLSMLLIKKSTGTSVSGDAQDPTANQAANNLLAALKAALG